MELTLKEVEVNKINLQPGDVLLVKLKGSEFTEPGVLEDFQKHAQIVFPNNRVSVLLMPEDHDIVFEAVSGGTKND